MRVKNNPTRTGSTSTYPISSMSRQSSQQVPDPDPDSGVTYEADPEFLEHARREETSGGDQPELPWDA